MTKLLAKVFQKASRLPDHLQEQLAQEMIEELLLIENADDFDREAAALGASAKFAAFLKDRSKETGGLTLREVRRKRGI